jgi:phosphatidyl-myo-inositol dimannoside synthase
MKQRRLAILTLDFPPQIGGVQQYLYEIGRRLGEIYKVTVVTPIAGELPPNSNMSKVTISSSSFYQFYRAIRRLKPDLLLVGHAHPQLLLSAKLSRRRYTAVAHGNDFLAAQSHWHHVGFNKLLTQAKPLITNSQTNAARLQALKLPKPIIIYPGTNPTQFTPKTEMTANGMTLLTIGRLVPRKGIDTTLQAVALLLEQHPALQYQIGGSGPDLPRLRSLVQQLGIGSNVTFLGHVAPETLPDVYREAAIFVMPTRERPQAGSIEGFGIVYLEASASGLPVVASRSGGAAEAVVEGETGFLIPPNDPAALADALDKLLQSGELRQKLGRNGRSWVETTMNWNRAARQFQAALAGENGS